MSALSEMPPKYAEDVASATMADVQRAFNVIKTGKSPFHYTIELPMPVMSEVADKSNRFFGRR